MHKIPKDKPIQVLSIGTKILMKDVMDQFLRSLGEVKTFYAYKANTAVETYLEKRPNIIFCEPSFPEGSALEFIRAIGGLGAGSDQYFVLAVEEPDPKLLSLAIEMGIDEILVKPFSTETIHDIVERFFEKKEASNVDWMQDLRTAKQSAVEKRFQESEELHAAAAKKYVGNNAVQIEAADYLLSRGYAAQAASMLESVLQVSPDNVRAMHLLAMAQKKTGRLAAAAVNFQRAIELSPLNSMRYVELAETYVAMAEEQVQSALKLDSESTSLILTKARYLLVRKDYLNLVLYLDAKRAFLSDSGKKEAEVLGSLGKKLGGIR
jgi:DNA-binding NarL/FixJ family response regulator